MALQVETCSMFSHINNYVKFYVVIEGFSPALQVTNVLCVAVHTKFYKNPSFGSKFSKALQKP